MDMTTETEHPGPWAELLAWVAAGYEERYLKCTVTADNPTWTDDDEPLPRSFMHILRACELVVYGDEDGNGTIEVCCSGGGSTLDAAAARVLLALEDRKART